MTKTDYAGNDSETVKGKACGLLLDPVGIVFPSHGSFHFCPGLCQSILSNDSWQALLCVCRDRHLGLDWAGDSAFHPGLEGGL